MRCVPGPPRLGRRTNQRWFVAHRDLGQVGQSLRNRNSTSTGRPTRAPVAQTNRTSAHRRSSCFAIFFPVAIPERPHPVPSRTRKLSSPGPMVLQGQLCGRVGRYRGLFEQPASNEAGCSLLYSRVFRKDPPPACAGAPSQKRPGSSIAAPALASMWRARGVGQVAEAASGVGPSARAVVPPWAVLKQCSRR